MTMAEYLAYEAASDARHEFHDGTVVAMAGGTLEHAALAAAVAGELRQALLGMPCRVFSADARVRITATRLTTYPDVSVVCGKVDSPADDPNAITNPTLLVEVLSESTEAYDRGAKAAHYRRIASLREYVFVSQTEPRVEVHRRNEHDRWELFESGLGQRAELASVGASLDVDALHANPLAV